MKDNTSETLLHERLRRNLTADIWKDILLILYGLAERDVGAVHILGRLGSKGFAAPPQLPVPAVLPVPKNESRENSDFDFDLPPDWNAARVPAHSTGPLQFAVVDPVVIFGERFASQEIAPPAVADGGPPPATALTPDADQLKSLQLLLSFSSDVIASLSLAPQYDLKDLAHAIDALHGQHSGLQLVTDAQINEWITGKPAQDLPVGDLTELEKQMAAALQKAKRWMESTDDCTCGVDEPGCRRCSRHTSAIAAIDAALKAADQLDEVFDRTWQDDYHVGQKVLVDIPGYGVKEGHIFDIGAEGLHVFARPTGNVQARILFEPENLHRVKPAVGLFVVFQTHDTCPHFQGVFTTEARARAACINWRYCYWPVTPDIELPEEGSVPEGVVFPIPRPPEENSPPA